MSVNHRDLVRPLAFQPPGDIAMTWLIGRRAAIEAMQDRLSLLMGVGFAVVLPILLVVLIVRSVGTSPTAAGEPTLGDVLALYLLVVGLMPTISAIGVAAGQFAGEKERGILTPLLASPASNMAIFGGKVLGAILPSLVYAVVADCVYLLSLAVLVGPSELLLLPLPLSLTMIALVPAVACFAASVASLISSRVRTYNAAQQIGGMVLMPVWAVVFALAAKLSDWGAVGMIGVLAGLALLDIVLTALAANTWRREEVLAQR
jgi:ABC-type Na+ efflux pump permease subunit